MVLGISMDLELNLQNESWYIDFFIQNAKWIHENLSDTFEYFLQKPLMKPWHYLNSHAKHDIYTNMNPEHSFCNLVTTAFWKILPGNLLYCYHFKVFKKEEKRPFNHY